MGGNVNSGTVFKKLGVLGGKRGNTQVLTEPQNKGATGHVPSSELIEESVLLFFWMALPDRPNSAATLL